MDIHADGLSDAVSEPNADSPGQIDQLEAQVAPLERDMNADAVIDQAIGVVVAMTRMTSAEVWDVLRETSMCTNIKLRHVAEPVVSWGRTGVLAADIREEVHRRLQGRIAL
ncbi:ANTAR domain-containing protein [Streptomyces sp. MI02-2A]|uniref:ANTAR domain-containing protein n=1 Tax=unclassified Streptomyces TaxID=2593676 RepID=UPI000E39D7A3|nr:MULTISPECIES: ANTAR domain-containing protein [unclassified Streptomyces]MDX3265731.1 ANTAR domain-containing protein [Streptomyces sp. MI02-2A]REE65689.1 ANTAR domain-containing protein [Streptomyces sp. 3212.3]